MAGLKTASLTEIMSVADQAGDATALGSCEAVAQKYADTLYNRFSQSIVLARIFAAVPFIELPDQNKRFINNLGTTAGISSLIKDQTPVLSLPGTAGANPQSNDRRRSVGHVGVPLASSHFIDSIPMMSRLLRQLGMYLAWIDG